MQKLLVANTPLFAGTTQAEVDAMLNCLGCYSKTYSKGDVIYRAGETVESMGMVLSGSVAIESDDVWGNKSILGHVQAGEIFAETYACIPGEALMVSAVALEKSEVLFLSAARILTSCSSACAHHAILIRNLLSVTARKNLGLSRRILHTSAKTIRGRLMSYLSEQAKMCGRRTFTIPFNRQQLADYLSVDRSAMSNELSKMQSEGIIEFGKREFTLNE